MSGVRLEPVGADWHAAERLFALRWLEERDAKTHQQRRIILGPEDDAVLDEQEAAARRRASEAGIRFEPSATRVPPGPPQFAEEPSALQRN